MPRQPPPQELQPQQPRQPPPQPPTAGFGYWDSASRPPPMPPQPPPMPPQQPPQQPWETVPPPWETMPPQTPYGYEHLYEQPYGEEPPGAHGFAPAGPRRAARSKTKLFVLVAGTVLAMLLAAGGVYYMSEGQGGGGGSTGAGSQDGGAPPEAGGGNEAGQGGGAGQRSFEGTWESGRKELTIGEKVRSGEDAGKNPVSYSDPRGEGVCFGTGDERKSGSVFRMALRCDGREKYVAGNSTRTDDELTVKWDEGDRETLTWQGD
ncbi:hypothetical protein AN215_22180 [Streptomyces abyssalis]|uniref:Uncharacterized protein n=1 Tax=Streptomyces abyssalis TaxID=933944 RepID=A0A1E7JFQ4_9ACTN|nr:hypothetical protein AN215_22180 [Streptomyces abyssalis]